MSEEDENPQFKKLFLDAFREIPARRTIIHDIFERSSASGQCGEILRIVHVPFRGAVFIIASHDNHYHVIHDCSYTSSHCRCSRIAEFRGVIKRRRFRRRTLRSVDFSIQHWVNLSEYLQTDSRRLCHLEVAGRKWVQCSETGRIQVQRCLQSGQKELVEDGNIQDDFPDFLGCGSQGTDSQNAHQSSLQANERSTRREKGSKGDRILQLLRKFPTAPIGHVFNTTLWGNSKYKWIPRSNTLLQKCIEYIGLEYCEKNIDDFMKIYSSIDPKNLIFNAPFGNISAYYYDLKTSIYVFSW